MKFSIVGWYNRHNCGDEAFTHAFDALLPGDKTFSLNPSPAHYTILGGGDVIKSYYLDRIEGDFFIMGAGIGYPSEAELLRGRRIKKAFFRNQSDVFLAKAQGVNAEYIPDIVFGLKAPLRTRVRPAGGKKLAAVILNDAINPTWAKRNKVAEAAYAEYFKWEMSESLSCLSEWYDLVFIPFSEDKYNKDAKIHADVIGRMERSHSVQETCYLQPLAALKEIANADLVVSMKFHGLVFSILAGVPFVNVGLSRKTSLLCQDFDLSKLSIEPFSFTKDRFIDAVANAERLDPEILKGIAEVNYERVHATFRQFRADFRL